MIFIIYIYYFSTDFTMYNIIIEIIAILCAEQ